MLACCVSRRFGFIHIPSPLLNTMAITLTTLPDLTAGRQKVLMVSLEVTGKGGKKKSTWLVFGLFIREKEAASLTELFIYLRNIWKPKYCVAVLEKDALRELGLAPPRRSAEPWQRSLRIFCLGWSLGAVNKIKHKEKLKLSNQKYHFFLSPINCFPVTQQKYG